MKIHRQEDVAVLLMSELVRSYNQRLVPLSEISKKHGISALFLKKIARVLRQKGLIESKEGIGGGYTLVREPREITVWEIISADTVPVRLWRESCPVNNKCLPQHVNRIIQESVEQSLKRINLANLVYEK